jgi:hypothetical protein
VYNISICYITQSQLKIYFSQYYFIVANILLSAGSRVEGQWLRVKGQGLGARGKGQRPKVKVQGTGVRGLRAKSGGLWVKC